ncbi:unnamed protein product [Aphanomyces euteiches]|uniref:Peptidase S1 domain-containing protein n=1 Tax=Aphanomyces euteiches TaxID=100861 RepID=A0A6G0WDV5_9STRA|nr:hypothetical protein Ae201684_016041 [Aphanomyces euteiches]KAH9078306.1 hypothetical protein Ae201684P_019397 [Aphanomyces euteiches]KAH9138387.1 hypothetical protein AeRB84_017285 [Aphanomyces euteiches]
MVNGTNIDKAPTPAYIATMGAKDQKTPDCTGILIAPRYILTNALCTLMRPQWATINSKYSRGGDGEQIAILSHVVHPKFDRWTLTYDIAVYLLERASINKPATLTFDTYDTATPVVFRGFGLLDYNAGFVDVLQEAKGIVAVNSDCNRVFRLDVYLSYRFLDDMMCVVGLTTCSGDGGPLTVVKKDGQEAVVALASWSSYRCKNQFGGFTRLSASQDFIKFFLPGGDVCTGPVERPSLH